jgi:hypothetical protein
VLAVLAAMGLTLVLLAPSALMGPPPVTSATRAPPAPAVPPTSPSRAPAYAEAGSIAVAPAGRPPQFVVLSFDGAGTTDLW